MDRDTDDGNTPSGSASCSASSNLEVLEAISGLKTFFNGKLHNLESNMSDMKESLKDTREMVSQALAQNQKLESSNKELERQVGSLDTKVKVLSKENRELKETVLKLECHSRRNNLQFTGFPEDKNETEKDCRKKVEKVISELDISFDHPVIINRCHRLGGYRQGNTRPILANFQCYVDRQKIFKARFSLPPEAGKVRHYIREDFPVEIEKRRSKLYPIVNAAKRSTVYKDKVHIKVDKLIVNNCVYTVETLHLLPQELNPRTLCERISEDGSTVCFFTRYSPLSNFHPSPLMVYDRQYCCVEQVFQHRKCILFDDKESANEIMESEDPQVHKAIGDRVRNFNRVKWESECESIMKEALTAKFVQNHDLCSHLLRTGSKTLAEASKRDSYWGTGLSIGDKDTFRKDLWGQNKLGKLLEEVRKSVK